MKAGHDQQVDGAGFHVAFGLLGIKLLAGAQQHGGGEGPALRGDRLLQHPHAVGSQGVDEAGEAPGAAADDGEAFGMVGADDGPAAVGPQVLGVVELAGIHGRGGDLEVGEQQQPLAGGDVGQAARHPQLGPAGGGPPCCAVADAQHVQLDAGALVAGDDSQRIGPFRRQHAGPAAGHGLQAHRLGVGPHEMAQVVAGKERPLGMVPGGGRGRGAKQQGQRATQQPPAAPGPKPEAQPGRGR